MSEEKQGPGTADRIGQAAGGITGILAGAAVGTAGGPLGVLLCGIAGAIGGWWTGRAVVEAVEDITKNDGRYARLRDMARAGFTRGRDRRRTRRVTRERRTAESPRPSSE
jgi:hypothetical protein